jgi:hypothetical protein
MEWSNGVIFLMATFWLEGLCSAELESISEAHKRIHQANLPNDSIGSFSDDILNVVLVRHIERDLSRPSAGGVLTLSHCGPRYSVSMR